MGGPQVFFSSFDPEPKDWKPLGILTNLSMVEKPQEDNLWNEIRPEARQLTNKTVTATFRISTKPTLEYRNLMRLFGVQSPSLIHNGKKRRKNR